MPTIIELHCRCGRVLRAKREQAGAKIRCWDCHAEVDIPWPRTGSRLAREALDALRDIGRAEVLFPTLLGAAAIAIALAIPVAGPAAAFALLAIAAALYREAVRRSGLHGAPGPPGPAWRTW